MSVLRSGYRIHLQPMGIIEPSSPGLVLHSNMKNGDRLRHGPTSAAELGWTVALEEVGTKALRVSSDQVTKPICHGDSISLRGAEGDYFLSTGVDGRGATVGDYKEGLGWVILGEGKREGEPILLDDYVHLKQNASTQLYLLSDITESGGFHYEEASDYPQARAREYGWKVVPNPPEGGYPLEPSPPAPAAADESTNRRHLRTLEDRKGQRQTGGSMCMCDWLRCGGW